jgi:LmbE family N-acetylglucosaminyl deacetylase
MAGQLSPFMPRTRYLVVAPHPDDETLGAGAWIARNAADVSVVHVTDGSPDSFEDARRVGFGSPAEYAAERRKELDAALDLAGVDRSNRRRFNFVDKDTYLNLPDIVARLLEVIADCRPDTVLSPAYEGGHPDHDTAALAVARALRLAGRSIEHQEYRLYHAAQDGTLDTNSFLPSAEMPREVTPLSGVDRAMKQRMLACFRSQQHFLKNFKIINEPFRNAPQYDFTRAPHTGTLLYERWDWGISGKQWRHHTQQELTRIA